LTRSVHGHLFDAYPVRGGMAVWLLAEDGTRLRFVHPWAPGFYYAGRPDALRQASALLRTLRTPVTARLARRRDLLQGDVAVTEITVSDPLVFPHVVTRLARVDDLVFYNSDIGLPQMYMYEHRLFPLGRCAVEATPDGMIREIAPLDSPWDQEYTVPPLTVLRLRLDGDPANPNHGHRAALHVAVDGEESDLVGETPADLLASLSRWLHRYDPDILLTEWGDSFLLPRLRRLAALCGHPLSLNRDPQVDTRTRRPRSYMTYGQIVYTAGGSYLHGRWHLDTTNSFTYEEAELPGLLELSRLGRMPVQHAARTSVGTVITSMQLDQAYQDGILIPWRKSRPEAFKSAGDLLLTDRGGLTYMPLIGAHEQVGELDFAAMYPAIMTRFNISQETVNCPCCRADPASRVPGIPHHLCQKRRGLIPRVLERVLERRAYYKTRRAATAGGERHVYNMRQTALKWIGVVCLDGDTLVLHRPGPRWRIAPIREIVDSHLPAEAADIKPVDALAVIGIDDRLQPCIRAVRRMIKKPAPETMIRVRLKWNRELLMTPDHPCYVLKEGRLEIKSADDLTVEDWIPLATSWEGTIGGHVDTIDLIAGLKQSIPLEDQRKWRVFGRPIGRVIAERGADIRIHARGIYAVKTTYNWKEHEYLPLQFISTADFSSCDRTELHIGFGRLNGGEIQKIPAVVRLDEDLGFLLGFFVGDGSISGNMVRFDVGQNEPELVERLQTIIWQKFNLRSVCYQEARARMYVLQVGSAALVRIFEHVLRIPGSADRGKLHVPEIILNGPTGSQRGFLLGMIASDGNVSAQRHTVSIASASRRLIRELGLLLTLLGVEYRIVYGKRLHRIETRNFNETKKLRFKRKLASTKHLKLLTVQRASSHHAESTHIPVVASGLRALCRAARVVRVPRIDKTAMVSHSMADLKLNQVKEKPQRFRPQMSDQVVSLERLLGSPLGFARAMSVERVAYKKKFVYCFEVDGDPAAFFVEGGVLTHNCFGYQGYKNARFGQIEAHECTTALSREMLLRAKEVAEAQGYRMLHALVDSVWLQKPGAAREEYEALARTIADATELPIAVEGVYRWIAFVPSRMHPLVGVPNRFFGVFEDGTSKVRGIELRRGDTPPLVAAMQSRMLSLLFQAGTLAEAWGQIPAVMDLLSDQLVRLRQHEVRPEELVIRTVLSQDPREYEKGVPQAVAAHQLVQAGVTLHPGEAIEYIITNAASRVPGERAVAYACLSGDWFYDEERYARMLRRAAETLLAPFHIALGGRRPRADVKPSQVGISMGK
jgi:DNA polymerase elongation subunit (family B)